MRSNIWKATEHLRQLAVAGAQSPSAGAGEAGKDQGGRLPSACRGDLTISAALNDKHGLIKLDRILDQLRDVSSTQRRMLAYIEMELEGLAEGQRRSAVALAEVGEDLRGALGGGSGIGRSCARGCGGDGTAAPSAEEKEGVYKVDEAARVPSAPPPEWWSEDDSPVNDVALSCSWQHPDSTSPCDSLPERGPHRSRRRPHGVAAAQPCPDPRHQACASAALGGGSRALGDAEGGGVGDSRFLSPPDSHREQEDGEQAFSDVEDEGVGIDKLGTYASRLSSSASISDRHNKLETSLMCSEDGLIRSSSLPRRSLPRAWPGCIKCRRVLRPKLKLSMQVDLECWKQQPSGGSSWKIALQDCRLEIPVRALDPSSPVRMVHDIVGGAILLYDIIVIPFMLAWDIPFDGWVKAISQATLAFWTCDLCVNFLTGYYLAGELELRPRRIAWHYLRTWFTLDFLIVVTDWVSIILSSQAEGAVLMGRTIRAGRLLRAVTLLRMVRLTKLFEIIVDRSLSDRWRMVGKVLMLLLALLFVNHGITCAWFAVARIAPSDTGNSWLDTPVSPLAEVGDNGLNTYDASTRLYQYSTSFHFAMSQVVAGSVEGLSPLNTWERFFNIVCLTFGLFFGTSLLSSISTSMIQLRMNKQDQLQKVRTLRQFLHQHRVNPRIAVRVQKQVMQRMADQKLLSEDDVPALNLLSVGMRAELRYETVRPYLLRHPLLLLWAQLDVGTVRKLCLQAVTVGFLSAGDDLFEPGTEAQEAYLVASGLLTYTQTPGSAIVQQRTVVEVGEGRWFCEAALWTHWAHVGFAQCVTMAQLLRVGATELSKAVVKHHWIHEIACAYGLMFHERVVGAVPPDNPFPSDIEVPCTDYTDIVTAMDVELQSIINEVAMQQLRSQWAPQRLIGLSALDDLEEEVRSGRSWVLLNGNQEVERVIHLAAVHIEHENGTILVQVGKWDGAVMKPECVLPGSKLERGETPMQAVARIFRNKLGEAFAEVLEVTDVVRDVCWKESVSYGIRTKYVRTVQHSTLTRSQEHMPRMRLVYSPQQDMPTHRTLSDPVCRRRARSHMWHNSTAPPEYNLYKANGGEGRRGLYAWMDESDFEQYNTSAGQKLVALWLARARTQLEADDDMQLLESGRRLPSAFEVRASTLRGVASSPINAICSSPSTTARRMGSDLESNISTLEHATLSAVAASSVTAASELPGKLCCEDTDASPEESPRRCAHFSTGQTVFPPSSQPQQPFDDCSEAVAQAPPSDYPPLAVTALDPCPRQADDEMEDPTAAEKPSAGAMTTSHSFALKEPEEDCHFFVHRLERIRPTPPFSAPCCTSSAASLPSSPAELS